MEPLIIEPGTGWPLVHLDLSKNKYEISGDSHPEDALGFYKQVTDWLDEYYKIYLNPFTKSREPDNEEMVFEFRFEYFNSSTALRVIEVLLRLKKFHDAGASVRAIWYHGKDDHDMKLAGEDYMEMVKMPFIIIEQQQP